MALIDDLLADLPDGKTTEVRIGLHQTAVVVETDGVRRCGLASTVISHGPHCTEPDVPQAGHLEALSGLELAALAKSGQPPLNSVGVAAINALLPQEPETWVDVNAEEVIASHGSEATVVLVGHFPFVPRLRPRVGELLVLEQRPQEGDLPESAASEAMSQADVVAITSMTLVNRSLEGLLKLCPARAEVLLLGPSTPLSPVLFEYGVDVLCGSVVKSIDPVLHVVGQGGTFRQVRKAGVQLVAVRHPNGA